MRQSDPPVLDLTASGLSSSCARCCGVSIHLRLLVLILLSVLMIPVGGGFVPAFIGVIAGAAGNRIHAPLTWWRRCSAKILNFLPMFWPWVLAILIAWIPGSWILGYIFWDEMLSFGIILFLFFDLVLPALLVFSAFAKDIQSNS